MDILSYTLGYAKGKAQGGSGGGSGDFKKGIYFEFLQKLPKAAINHRFFEYKGSLYLFVVTSTSSKTADIYKYENNKFTLITTITNTDICGTGFLSRGYELNDKVYFMYTNNRLVEWDGTNMTVVNSSLPFTSINVDNGTPFTLHNNELIGFASVTGGIQMYKINADFTTTLKGTYSISNSTTTKPSLSGIFSINNELYIIAYIIAGGETSNRRWLCKFNGNEFEPYIMTSASATGYDYAVVNNKLYIGYSTSTGYGNIVEFDLTNKTATNMANTWGHRTLFDYNNELYVTDIIKYYAFAKGHIVSGE